MSQRLLRVVHMPHHLPQSAFIVLARHKRPPPAAPQSQICGRASRRFGAALVLTPSNMAVTNHTRHATNHLHATPAAPRDHRSRVSQTATRGNCIPDGRTRRKVAARGSGLRLSPSVGTPHARR